MTLRKLTSDNSVKYISQSEQTRDNEPNMIKNDSLPQKQNKKLSQNNKNFIKVIISGEGFRILI